MSKKKTQNKNTSIKKPKFVLTDVARFYLATKDMTNENDDGLFFIVSLFLPMKNEKLILTPHKEIATFDDAESAVVYHDTIAKMAQINAKSQWNELFADAIAKFNENEK